MQEHIDISKNTDSTPQTLSPKSRREYLISLVKGKKALFYTLFIVVTGAILYLTLSPPDEIPKQALFKFDKAGHFIIFFGWTSLFGLLRVAQSGKKARLISILLSAILFGLMIELLQHMMPFKRNAEMLDMVSNVAGSLTALFPIYILRKKVPD